MIQIPEDIHSFGKRVVHALRYLGFSLVKGNITLGNGAPGVDYTVTVNGETNDGVFTWKEDEDYFEFSDDIHMLDQEAIYFDSTDTYIAANTDDPEDLVIAADQDILLQADARVIIDTPDANGLVIGNGTANINYKLTFDGETNDGNFTFMEDEKVLLNDFGWGSTPDEITSTSEGVAASIQTTNTEVTTNGDSDLDNVTLANGISGQIKHIYCVAEGNAADTWKITPAALVGGTQITFSGLGEGCTLIYADNEGWIVIGNNGGTIS